MPQLACRAEAGRRLRPVLHGHVFVCEQRPPLEDVAVRSLLCRQKFSELPIARIAANFVQPEHSHCKGAVR